MDVTYFASYREDTRGVTSRAKEWGIFACRSLVCDWLYLIAWSRSPTRCPLSIRKRTKSGSSRMSALCHKRTYAAQQKAPLFDHLVGAGEQRRRNADADALAVCRLMGVESIAHFGQSGAGRLSRADSSLYSLIVRTTLEVGRVSVIGPFNCFRMASSYEAIVVTEYFGCMNTIL